jgi:zinc transport system substrate-binding protein
MRFFAYLIAFFCVGICHANENYKEPLILVSTPAYQKIVQELVGKTAIVSTVVPAGMNLHSYEPTPQHLNEISQAILWLCIGDPFETKVCATFKNGHGPVTVDLRQNVPLLFESGCHHHLCADPHIWTSPKMMKIQLETIKSALIKVFPEESKNIELRYETISARLDLLVQELDRLLSPYNGKIILIAHAAYGYLCRDYGLNQQSIEQEGKEPTLKALERLLQVASEHHVNTVFILPQYPTKGAERVSSLLKASLVEINPYDENYFSSTLTTAEKFAHALAEQKDEPK